MVCELVCLYDVEVGLRKIIHITTLLRKIQLRVVCFQIAVALLDCQGTGDPVQGTALDTLLVYMSLQLCNVQILNLQSRLKNTDFLRLKVHCNKTYVCSVHLNIATPFRPTLVTISIEFERMEDESTGKHWLSLNAV